MSNLIFPSELAEIRVNITGPQSDQLSSALGITSSQLENSDVAIFMVSAVSGFAPEVTSHWQMAREIYLPSLVAIVDLENSEIDFEDMSVIVSKTLDPVVTPYLVLHSEDGFPTAVISLETEMITDYTLGLRREIESDPEHKQLIQEFRVEYLEDLEAAGDEPFANALLFPAIPLAMHIKLGLAEIAEWLRKLPGRS